MNKDWIMVEKTLHAVLLLGLCPECQKKVEEKARELSRKTAEQMMEAVGL